MGKLLTLPNLVVLAIIDEYFKDILLTLCVYTTGKQVELASGQFVREWELSQLSNQSYYR